MSLFKYVCFHILLDHHREGIEAAAPGYITSKFDEFEMLTPEEAFQKLDPPNQIRAVAWAKKWGYDLPDGIRII